MADLSQLQAALADLQSKASSLTDEQKQQLTDAVQQFQGVATQAATDFSQKVTAAGQALQEQWANMAPGDQQELIDKIKSMIPGSGGGSGAAS
ncbi:MAG: hypothetical protein V9E98_05110 [Candidatus Nanopelagicales bacterium]